jgi:tRNA(adenine34) deaminase
MVALPEPRCTIRRDALRALWLPLWPGLVAAAAGERVVGRRRLDDAQASACDRVRGSGDPTAHAVIGTLREAAERLGTTSLSGLTVYVVREPCAMCVGAMLESDVDGVVFAVPDPLAGAAGSALQLARGTNGHAHRLNVVSGILEADAAELLARADRPAPPRQPDPAAHA